MDMTVSRSGERCSAARAYLHPAMRRSNVKVLTRSHAVRVLFDGTSRPRAVGVQYVDASGDVKVCVRKRVCMGWE
jgi:choline dehydrogenase